MSFRCPSCKKDTGLWRGVLVPGWEAIGAELEPTGRSSRDREVDWHGVEPDGSIGCAECQWEGIASELERVSAIDGEPLPRPHPRQEALAL